MMFTDDEYRLLLSAISRERKVCEEIDNDKVLCSNTKMLVPIVNKIERKIMNIQKGGAENDKNDE